MATKAEGCSCYEKAAPDEPLFVLRAQDVLAPDIVRRWAGAAVQAGVPMRKVREARALADDMEEWAKAHGGAKTPD